MRIEMENKEGDPYELRELQEKLSEKKELLETIKQEGPN